MLFRMTALVHMESIRYLVLKVAPQAILQDPQCDAEALSHFHDLAIADGEGKISSRAFRAMLNDCLEMNA
jgi:hypothetical protein